MRLCLTLTEWLSLANRRALGIVEKSLKIQQRLHVHVRRSSAPHRRATSALEHPSWNLKRRKPNSARTYASENLNAPLAKKSRDRHLLAVERMPSILDSQELGFVGIVLCGSTTPSGRTKSWAMQRRRKCITRPSPMEPSRRRGGGNDDRGAPGVQPSVRPFAPGGAQGLTPGWTPEPRSGRVVKTQNSKNN